MDISADRLKGQGFSNKWRFAPCINTSVRLPKNSYPKAKNIGLRYGMSQITHTATLNL